MPISKKNIVQKYFSTNLRCRYAEKKLIDFKYRTQNDCRI